MSEELRWKLCLVGLTKLVVAAALFAVGALLVVQGEEWHAAAFGLFGLGGAVGLGGHALCQSCCVTKGKGPPDSPADGPR